MAWEFLTKYIDPIRVDYKSYPCGILIVMFIVTLAWLALQDGHQAGSDRAPESLG
jgi:hypothetical protein